MHKTIFGFFSGRVERIKRGNPFANRPNSFLSPPAGDQQGSNTNHQNSFRTSFPNSQSAQGLIPSNPQNTDQASNPVNPAQGRPNYVAQGSNFNFATQNGLTVPALQKPLGGSFLGDKLGANVDLANPSVSANRGFDGFGLFSANEGINKVGDRGDGNFGGGFGRSASILGGRYGIGDNTDLNVNKDNGLKLNRQRGIPGILTDNSGISSNPLSGNLFGTSQQTCIGEMFIKGLCFQKQLGIGK